MRVAFSPNGRGPALRANCVLREPGCHPRVVRVGDVYQHEQAVLAGKVAVLRAAIVNVPLGCCAC